MSADSDIPLFANLHDADPDVVTALREAKKTLPRFLEAAASRRFASTVCLVKLPFVDRGDAAEQAVIYTAEMASKSLVRPSCHLWLRVTSVQDDLVFCSVGEAPEQLRLNVGDSFVVSSDSIEDWMINHSGEVFGGFSLRVIRNRLDADARMKFDAHTGIRRFKELVP